MKSGYTFLGWCYDEACTKYVATTDRLLGDITLYASYAENQPFESHSIATFARAIDVEGDSLVIQITDKSGALRVSEILKACTLTNLSDFTEEITLGLAAAGNNTYTIIKKNGWKEGSNYKLVLDNDDLYFTGFDTTIREYEISIHKDEVKNVSLNPKIKYINVKELSNLTVNGESVQSVSVATMTLGTDGTVLSEGSSASGTFTYTERPLKLGDQIAVYAGDVIPTMDEAAASADGSNISFFEITAVDGTNYSYRGSQTEDVLFMPDVLPLDLSKDQDGDDGNNSVTVDISELTFNDSSDNPSLSADTTVDEGDYLALYKDINDPDTLSYGKITSVLLSEGKYIISYQPQTLEDVRAAMDVYTTEPIAGKDLIADTDVEALEGNIEAQAFSSGFAEDVAEQISMMTLRTDSFAELEKMLSEELDADVEIQCEDVPTVFSTRSFLETPSTFASRTTFAARGAAAMKRVEVGLPQVSADLDTKLQHFDGNESGLHLALEISVPITFHVARFADFTITVTATFEQEVRVDINVDGEAEWKWWGIFPYIADYRVTASLELYEYTGIALEINFKTEETDNFPLFTSPSTNNGSQFKKKQKIANNVESIVTELEDMMENGREYISDKSPLVANIGGEDLGVSDDDRISVAKSLAERYADLIEDDGDWVEIYTRNITDRHIRVILVIDIAIEVDFVVWAKVNVSIGMSFWYKNAKRYVFCLHVKGRKATSDTINITEEQYEFDAYAMGTIGIKAGVRLTLRVGLISTELASVGLRAEAGGYVQLWGYLYYILKYAASTGRETRAIGALYLEIGIYLDIRFLATALANAFTYAPTLFEAMWPLYTAGTRENVLGFADTDETECEMKYEMKKVRLPDDFFTMNYMDMKEGLDDNGEYFTKIYEDDSDKYFTIEMTNDAFTYDPKTNFITVDPGSEKSVDGEMIVTWKSQPGTFNTNPFQKKVKLHWDMLRDGYVIGFISNGGSYVAPISKRYGAKITKPADPTKQGYTFAGWYLDEELTKPYTIPDVMPDEDALAFAKWTPAQVTYTVKTYLQGTNGIYEVPEDGIETGKAYTDSTISPQPKTIEGFETPEVRSVKVKADGSTLIEYYYPRNKYTATYKSDNEVVSTGSYRYGSMMPVPAVYKPGYDFVGWIPEGENEVVTVPDTVPAKDVTYYAKWVPQSGISYTVKYYVQEENGEGYHLNEIKYLTGDTDTTVTAPAGSYDAAIYHLKDNASLPSGVIKADGSLELRVYYDLNTYTVTYDKVAADASMPDGCALTFTARPGQKLLTEIPRRKGYDFKGWYLDAGYNYAFDNTMPSRDITLYAKWERIKANYTVRHYQENLAILNEYGYPEGGEKTYTLVEEEVFAAPIDEEVTPAVKDYEGFTAPATQTKTVTVDAEGNGTLVIEYYYARNEYTLEWSLADPDSDTGNDDMIEAVPHEYQYGAPITIPDDKEFSNIKNGYRIEGWYTDQNLTEPFDYETMPAKDLTAFPKWVAQNIEYTVYYEFMDGASVKDTITETFTGLADSEVDAPEVKTFEGYTFDESTRLQGKYKIDPDNPYVYYKYNINSYTLTYQYETNSGTKTEPVTKNYGEDITFNPVRDGFAFAGWYTEYDPTNDTFSNPYVGTTMPDKNLKLYGKWVSGMQSYQVVHYLTKPDGTKGSLYLVENLYEMSGTVVTPPSKAPEGYEDVTPVSHTLVAGSVENNRIEYVYPRKQYQVTYHLNGGTSIKETVESLTYEAEIDNYPGRSGYEFTGWYLDEALQTPLTDKKMPAHDLTLYAGWSVLKSLYKVEHYRENAVTGNYLLTEISYHYADTDSTVEPAVKQYYGYTSPSVKTGTVTGDSTNPLVIQYYYDCNKYTLTLHDAVCEDGISVSDVTLEKKYGSSIPAQTRKNYNFGGWYLDAAYTEAYNGMMPDENLTLYAKWIPEMRYYKFVYRTQTVNGGYVDYKVVEGNAPIGTVVTPEMLILEGLKTPDLSPKVISSNYYGNVYTLQYPRNIHTVTFKLDNGESDVVRRNYYGSEIIPPVPKKEGYTFIGWDSTVPDTIPDQDLTYTARWKINSYHIAFMADNQDLGATYEYGQTINKPADPTKDGYIFKGWSDKVPDTMPARDINLTAEWELQRYSITYDLGGGRAINNPYSYTYESSTFTLKEPTRSHYKFLGWSWTENGEEKFAETVTIQKNSTGNRHYTAKWEAVKYKITFADNGATLGMGVQEVTYEERTKLWKCTAAPTGYKFYAWSPVREDPYARYFDESILYHVGSDITLYPIYVPQKYRVTFDYNKDPYYYSYNEYEYMTGIDLPQVETTDPYRHYWGYVLNGWDMTKTNNTDNTDNTENTNSTKNSLLPSFDTSDKSFTLAFAYDVTLTAKWEPNNKYVYTPSDYKQNVYNITDGKDREISFTFYVDGKQTGQKVTGDYGLGNGADYVINMDNMSYDVVSKAFNKVKVEVQYNVHKVKTGYAVMRLKYKPKGGKEVTWKTESTDLDSTKITQYFPYELDRTDIEYFKIEFDANGGGEDEYNLDQVRLWVTYSKEDSE
ncbi:MAG: InlB B-repeat-containing protein [Butyrivibrio sp.]